MRKLNEKGFAFSTMLYGTLALLTLTLYVVLDVSKSSYDDTYFYGDTIELKLLECSHSEINLEKCYSSGNMNCDATRYHACLGVSDDTTTPQNRVIAESLKEKVVETGDGLYKDTRADNRYYYKGDNVNNYISYLGKTWRIVSIESDGSLRLISTTPINEMWHSGGIGGIVWKNSALNQLLNDRVSDTGYAKDIPERDSGEWLSTFVYPSDKVGTTFSLDDFTRQKNNQSNIEDSKIVSYNSVGVLSIDDYIKASNNMNCTVNMLETTGCTSWLSQYGGWTNNINAEAVGYITVGGTVVEDPEENSTLYDTNYIYYFDSTQGKILTAPCGETKTVYPVLYINRNHVLVENSSHAGTQSHPYGVE